MTRLIPVQSPGPAKARQVPRAPLPATGVLPLALWRLAPHQRALLLLQRSYWLMRQTKTLPPTSVVPNTTGLCRLSPVPAGSWPFPTLSLQSLRRCLDPYPAVSSWCICPLLPRRQRPHLRRHRFGTPNNPCNATSTGKLISGLRFDMPFDRLTAMSNVEWLTALSAVEGQSFRYVQAPTLARPPGCTHRRSSK